MPCIIKDFTIEDIKKWLKQTNEIINENGDLKEKEINVYSQLGVAEGLFEFILSDNGVL